MTSTVNNNINTTQGGKLLKADYIPMMVKLDDNITGKPTQSDDLDEKTIRETVSNMFSNNTSEMISTLVSIAVKGASNRRNAGKLDTSKVSISRAIRAFIVEIVHAMANAQFSLKNRRNRDDAEYRAEKMNVEGPINKYDDVSLRYVADYLRDNNSSVLKFILPDSYETLPVEVRACSFVGSIYLMSKNAGRLSVGSYVFNRGRTNAAIKAVAKLNDVDMAAKEKIPLDKMESLARQTNPKVLQEGREMFMNQVDKFTFNGGAKEFADLDALLNTDLFSKADMLNQHNQNRRGRNQKYTEIQTTNVTRMPMSQSLDVSAIAAAVQAAIGNQRVNI